MFSLLASSPLGRRGIIRTAHGDIPTPCFMPVGTGGAMRGITLEDLESLGADILLCNTYHLHIRPGETVVRDAGGLHAFTGWRKPIITDSGGFQVFSLTDLRDVTDAGVHFQSHLDGTALFLGPEESIRIQHTLGADIILCFDECPPSTAPREVQIAAVERTLRWAKRCKEVHDELKATSPSPPSLFAIVQGGLERDLRERCVQELVAMDFDGYAIGGLAVGETEAEMMDILDVVCPLLPAQKPRYLMGVGRLEQMRQAVKRGVDMFDCVLPMREARHGTIYLSSGERIRITSNPYMRDHSPIDPDSPVPSSRTHARSYLNYLLRADERYGETLACLQNLGVTLEMMRTLREQLTP
ncbi:MAG: queuine tRNA-ribosyltransferase [Candidatus Peregrinibacteria bacterium Gr01-1014_25]|nr:MAG: queuine tRNA-ribosyltransferase [Candidatus Peregrinibacteria bacterium Gr01-1014_25]